VQDDKAQQTLGITETDIRIARNQSITSTHSSLSHVRSPIGVQSESRSLRQDESKFERKRPQLELKASSILLHEEFHRAEVDKDPVPPMPIRNLASSSTLRSHYDSQKVPLSVSQQTSESSRRDLALRKGSPRVLRFPFGDRESPGAGGRPPRLSSVADGRKLSKQRPHTSEAPQPEIDPHNWRPETGYESIPSIKSMNDVSTTRGFRSSKLANHKPGTGPRRLVTTNKALLEPMDPASLKVNVRRPKMGAKHWFDGLEEDSSEEDGPVGEPEFQDTFVSGIESAFRDDKIKPPSDGSSVRIDGQSFDFSNSSIATPKQFLKSTSSVGGPSPRIATLHAKASRSSMAQNSTKSTQAAANLQNPKADIKPEVVGNSFLNLSCSDDEEDLPQNRHKTSNISSRHTSARGTPDIRDSVAMGYRNESPIEIGTALTSSVGAQHPRLRTLKVAPRNSNNSLKNDQIRMPVPKRGSSLALHYLHDQAEKQSAVLSQEDDLIPSFPATPTESDNSAYRMSVSVFSDTASIESRRMMSVTKQEESLLAAMRLKKAAMKQNITQDKRKQALHNLERGQSVQSGRGEHSHATSQRASYVRQPGVFHPRHPMHRGPSRQIEHEDAYSRNSGTTFQTNTTARQSRLTYDTATPMNRLSLSSDSQEQSASPSMLSLNTTDRRESRDTYLSSPGAQGHARQRTESSHFSHVVALDDLDKVPDSRDEITSQDFIDWPYRGWSNVAVAH
jgi:hypothetical protein